METDENQRVRSENLPSIGLSIIPILALIGLVIGFSKIPHIVIIALTVSILLAAFLFLQDSILKE